MVREYAMNTTGMAAEWMAEMDRVGHAIPGTLPLTEHPLGRCVVTSFAGDRGGIYTAQYEYESANGGFLPRLRRLTCDMPPVTPQADSFRLGDKARLFMMDQFGPSAALEAEQRRKEWAEIAAQEAA